MVKEFKMSQERYDELKKELDYSKTTRADEIAELIKEARGFGDLSENSEYDEAKNEQAIMEARIADIEVMLKNVRLIDESELHSGNIHIGSTVTVDIERASGTTEKTYKIVGSNEANPREGRISDESAVGKALLGHTKGDVVEVEVPAGVVKYHVKEIG